MLISRNTSEKLSAGESSPKIPTAASITSMVRTTACMTAGRLSNLVGSGGKPSDIEDRDRKTVV